MAGLPAPRLPSCGQQRAVGWGPRGLGSFRSHWSQAGSSALSTCPHDHASAPGCCPVLKHRESRLRLRGDPEAKSLHLGLLSLTLLLAARPPHQILCPGLG